MEASPKLTMEQAKALTDEAIAAFEKKENADRLKNAVIESAGDPAKKMALVLPIVQELSGPVMTKYGFPSGAVMQAVMAVQMHAMNDPDLKAKITSLQSKLMGNF